MSIPRCPYCLDDLLPDQARVRCKDCRTPHHEVCFHEHGGCVAFGCAGEEEVESDRSIYIRPETIKIGGGGSTLVELGPFQLSHSRLTPIRREERPRERCPDPYARISLHGHEVREGELIRGRGVIYVPTETPFRRVDLLLLQSIGSPRKVARVPLVSAGKGLLASQTLSPGSHSVNLELLAPVATPLVDPYLLELVLVRGMFGELSSRPRPLFLLQQPDVPEEAGAPPAIHIGPARPARVHLPPPEPADVGELLPSDGGWVRVPIHVAGNLYDSGERTSRAAQVRYYPFSEPQDGLRIESPSLPVAPEFAIRIQGGGHMSSLNMAVHYELIRPGGKEVILPGFPCTEELFLLGSSPLDPTRYGGRIGLEVVFQVPPERLEALAQAREEIAHNAALRLRLALDAIDISGRVVPAATRSVTFTSG